MYFSISANTIHDGQLIPTADSLDIIQQARRINPTLNDLVNRDGTPRLHGQWPTVDVDMRQISSVIRERLFVLHGWGDINRLNEYIGFFMNGRGEVVYILKEYPKFDIMELL